MNKSSSLDGLLSGLGGVEGDILKSKRQSMASSAGLQNGPGHDAGRHGSVADGIVGSTVSVSDETARGEFTPAYLDVEQLLGGASLSPAECRDDDPGGLDGLEDVLMGSAADVGAGDGEDDFLVGIYGEQLRGEAKDAGGLLGEEFGATTVSAAEAGSDDGNVESSGTGEDVAHLAQYQYQGVDFGEDPSLASPLRLSPTRLSPRKSPKPSAPPAFQELPKTSAFPDFGAPPSSPRSPRSPNHHHQTMADMGHKAAKGLQTAKNWLFSASKTIARDVQSRIDAHKEKTRKEGGGHRRRPSIIDSPPSDFVPEEHHQMWAQQLVHAPPETQAAALDAMEDYDRMAVQQVIDEMVWYEAKQRQRTRMDNLDDELRSTTYQPETHPAPDALRPARPPPPPPPATSLTVTRPSPPLESFDLLNLSDKKSTGDVENVVDQVLGGQGAPSGPSFVPTSSVVRQPSADHQASQQQAEPSPNRQQLKAERLARNQKRVDEVVASARDQASRDASEKEEKVAIRERLRPEIEAWMHNKKDNIRSLLCTMDAVVWSGAPWKSPSVVDVMEPGQVRKWYMKANLVVHPDKVKQSHGSLEQLTRAEMIFDVLKHAWGKFS